MDRISHASAVDIGGGRRGFRSKDTVAGLAGTVVTATHMNAGQEEAMALIEAAGLVPDADDLTQVLSATRSQAANYRVVGGTPNALTFASVAAHKVKAYLPGHVFRFRTGAAANTGPCTFKADDLPAIALLKRNGLPVKATDLSASTAFEGIVIDGGLHLLAPVASDMGTGELPIQALPFPEVFTADKMVAISVGMKAGQGGYVLMNGGETIAIGRGVGGGLGLIRQALVPLSDFGWSNANHLAAGSTYYLRAYLDAEFNLVPYLQRGTDADAEPGGLVGTAGAGAGGGFDSTRLDILLGKIVTGAAGTTPVLTRYANAAQLSMVATRSTPQLSSTSGVNTIWSSGGESVYVGASGGVNWTLVFPLLWARKPSAIMVAGAYNVGTATAEQYLSGYAGVLTTSSITRDAITAVGATDYLEATVWSGGTLNWTNHSGALRIVAIV